METISVSPETALPPQATPAGDCAACPWPAFATNGGRARPGLPRAAARPSGRGDLPGGRRLAEPLPAALRLREDPPHQPLRTGTDHRLSHRRRSARAGRHRDRRARERRHRAGRLAGLRAALRGSHAQLPPGLHGRPALQQADRPRHQRMPPPADGIGMHDDRRTRGEFPDGHIATDGGQRLLAPRVHPEDDARRHRQPPRDENGNRVPRAGAPASGVAGAGPQKAAGNPRHRRAAKMGCG